MEIAIQYCSRTFYLYHQHLIRGKYQSKQIKELSNNLTVSKFPY